MGLSTTEEQRNKLLDYLELLHKWNASYNLSGIDDPEEMLTRHILDSLTLLPFIEGKLIADLGTGAGLPGIPLAIVKPEADFILLDSNGKKTRFLFQAQLNLSLPNTHIENCRIEHYQSSRQIDIVTCRAFSSLTEILSSGRHLFSEGSKLLAMKGLVPDEELKALPPGFRLDSVDQLQVPGLNESRSLVSITCISAAEADRH